MRDDQIVAMLVPGGTEHAGGIGRWAGYLAQEWRAGGLVPPIELIDTRGFGGWHVGAWRFTMAIARLLRLRATGRLGVIHANLSASGSTVRKCIVSAIARAMGVPLVLHLHSGRYFDFYGRLPAVARAAVRRMFLRAAQVVALGDGWAALVSATFGIPRATIVVMPNGVRGPTSVTARSSQSHEPLVLFLGRLGPGKGVPELIEALGDPRLAGLEWRATLAGDGDPLPYRARAAALGIDGRIAFPGWLDGPSVATLLRDADLLVLPSRQENLPVSVVEALAHRVAVVATPVGALPELLKEGESVCFVPIGDAAALAAAITDLLGDAASRARIAEGGHAVFAATLDIAAQAARLRAIYRRLMRMDAV